MNRNPQCEGGQELVKFGPISLKPRDAIKSIIAIQSRFIPKKYFEEIAGLAPFGTRSRRGQDGQLHSGAVPLQRLSRS